MPRLLERRCAMRVLLVTATLLALSACASGGTAQRGGAPGLRNPTGFPLYPGARIVAAHPFRQRIEANAATGTRTIFAAGNGVYDGHEVVASTGATFAQLSHWIDALDASPPKSYAALEAPGSAGAFQARGYGVDYALFRTQGAAGRKGVLVVVMDPQSIDEKLGGVLGMIARYRSLPELFRQPVDDAAKARYGFSISQITQPDSPIGAALDALAQVRQSGERGIVVVEAVKQAAAAKAARVLRR